MLNDNSTGGKIRIPDAVVVRGSGPTWTEYNALVDHANELARAVEMQQCYKHQAERESKCAWQRVDELESSWLPGRLITSTKCKVEKIRCEAQ